ncbi:MAG: chemotaxis protein CheA [Clostridiales bacterium]|jgi:two-component system chemotaxis sensor kinase CheA|nr:chemotaxis protein CheA [Eubacteriales bacterium]MDH7565022.1 chemotaxis protein CheA [Clostridiales bacterium]
MDMSQYIEIFIEESKEHLQALNQSLLQLEQNPNDTAMINEIFRVAHTLKGMAGTMGFNKMARFTHDMEDVLQALRNDEIKANSNLVDVLFKCLDALESYLDNIVNSGSEGDEQYDDILQVLKNLKGNNSTELEFQLKNASEETAAASSALLAEPAKDVVINQYEQNVINKALEMRMNVYTITVVLNKGCLLKAARAFIIFQALEKYGEIIKSEPKVEDIEDEKFDFRFTVIVISKESKELFAKELNSIAEIDEVIINPLESDTISGETRSKTDNTLIKPMGQVTNNEDADEGKKDSKDIKPGTVSKPKTGKTVRVDIDRLDMLMNLVSELIIIKTRLEELEGVERSQRYNEAVEYLERITTNMHDAVMKVRMVPIETVFNRFPRMIRDISKELGKEIILTMSGEETELDRTVIDEIGDPLIHLLRNSADHGIESSEKRKRAGKPEAGNISLRAYQAGNNVIIEVEDDGQGLNLEQIKHKAIERGLVSQDMAGTLSQKDIIDFIFRPSFSTADKITDISGRGVGLDVVKTKIEALGGMVEVETEPGKGSKFIIRLPLTLAIIQALLVLINKEKYAIPLNAIKEIINIVPEDIKMVQKQEVILLRNMVVPIVRLDKVLAVPQEEEKVQKQLTAVIVKKGDKLSGFLVDSLIGQQEIVIKSLGKLLVGIKCIAGATILGDGNVALILDVNSLA